MGKAPVRLAVIEYAGNRLGAVRAATGYSGASRVGESRIFSPTQSFSRLMARSLGSSVGPPSQPQAATSEAGPATSPSRMKSRRVRPIASAMAREPPSIPAGDHAAQRRPIHQQHQGDVHQRERHEDPHRPEVPVPGELVPAEEPR